LAIGSFGRCNGGWDLRLRGPISLFSLLAGDLVTIVNRDAPVFQGANVLQKLIRLSDLTETGIMVRPHKTINTKRTARIFEWTPALKLAVEQAKAARPIDISPWLFCTREGQGYFNEDSGQASGWDSMWQRFMTRLLKDTDVKERFTEHDLRAKVGSDLTSIERATDLLGHASKEITKRHYRRKPEVIKPVR
jgi:integrase